MEDIKLKVKLEFSEIIKLRYAVAYKSPLILFFTIIGLGMLGVVISYFSGYQLVTDGAFPTLQIVFSFFFLIIIPMSIITSTKKDLQTNKFISQSIVYVFRESDFVIKGESFSMENSWTDLHKIKELENWFILYTSRSQALFIPKNRFENLSDMKNFKSLLETLSVKKSLL